MPCDRVRAQLTAYLEGELEDDRGTVVRGHLRTCAACRQVAEDEAALRDGLRALPTVDPPASLWAGVQAQLAAEEVAEARRPAWRRALARWARGVAAPRNAMVGVLVGAAAVTLVWWKSERAPDVVASDPETVVIGPTRPVFEPATSEDVTDDLRAEPARIAASYQQTIDELLEVAADMRSEWSEDRKVAFDTKLELLQAELASAPSGKAKRRASSALIDYLHGVLIREDVVLASAGSR
jgi:hypothetical protein